MINGKPNPHHELWRRWANLRNMCNNPNNHCYAYYGGRGIGYPKHWDDFPTFVEEVEEAIGPLPFKGAHLDRPKNDRSYSKRNIRWATAKENYNNRRSNHMVAYQGRKQTLAEWSRETGIPLRTIWSRLFDRGLPPSKALDINYRYRKTKGK